MNPQSPENLQVEAHQLSASDGFPNNPKLPSGPILAVEAGDVAILPAGTGHKCIEASSDFLVVGAYPGGHEDYDLLRGDPAEQAEAEQRIAEVPLPKADPAYGDVGPLLEHWTGD